MGLYKPGLLGVIESPRGLPPGEVGGLLRDSLAPGHACHPERRKRAVFLRFRNEGSLFLPMKREILRYPPARTMSGCFAQDD